MACIMYGMSGAEKRSVQQDCHASDTPLLLLGLNMMTFCSLLDVMTSQGSQAKCQ